MKNEEYRLLNEKVKNEKKVVDYEDLLFKPKISDGNLVNDKPFSQKEHQEGETEVYKPEEWAPGRQPKQ